MQPEAVIDLTVDDDNDDGDNDGDDNDDDDNDDDDADDDNDDISSVQGMLFSKYYYYWINVYVVKSIFFRVLKRFLR